ncbi:hypothetical protein [Streptomyces otsuchiensis]|uniref:hypothetical protein n=1 Tax=Streptomyces otsuchiensis TaxID=2681388 RepID=UPI00102FD64C|nr:hypothetical protein [Streptomyces otsuchiensis]
MNDHQPNDSTTGPDDAPDPTTGEASPPEGTAMRARLRLAILSGATVGASVMAAVAYQEGGTTSISLTTLG